MFVVNRSNRRDLYKSFKIHILLAEAAMGVQIHAQDNPEQPYIKAVQE